MAQKTTVHLVDDLDGSEADETVAFSLDGTAYEIDLNDAHAGELRDALARYVAAARKAGPGGARRPGPRRAGASASTSDRQRTQEIRTWAREQGMEVNERGRIPSKVLKAYDDAH